MACIARDNALDYLIKKGAVDNTRKILDISLFNELNDKLTQVSIVKYNMDMGDAKLFAINATTVPYQRGVTTERELGYKVERAVPNQNLFLELDRRIKAYEERSAQPVSLNDTIDTSTILEFYDKSEDLQKIGNRTQYLEYLNSIMTFDKVLVHSTVTPFEVFDKDLVTMMSKDMGVGLYVSDLANSKQWKKYQKENRGRIINKYREYVEFEAFNKDGSYRGREIPEEFIKKYFLKAFKQAIEIAGLSTEGMNFEGVDVTDRLAVANVTRAKYDFLSEEDITLSMVWNENMNYLIAAEVMKDAKPSKEKTKALKIIDVLRDLSLLEEPVSQLYAYIGNSANILTVQDGYLAMEDDSLSADIEKADLFIEGNADNVEQGILKNPNAYVKLGSLQDQQNFAKFMGKSQSIKAALESIGRENILDFYNSTNFKSLALDIAATDIEEMNNLGVQEATEVMVEMLSKKLSIGYERISSDEAVEILGNRTIGYNGESSFYFAGKVYLVGENVTMNTALHEFGHPLIMSIKQLNPKLFNNLVDQTLSTPEGEVIKQEILKEYPELNETTDLFKEELLTYSLQVSAANKVNEQIESKGFKALIKKLLATLKSVLRDIFGKVKVSKINENTTLDELTDLLLGDKKINLELARITQDDVVRFGKMLVERAKAVTDNVNTKTINKMIEQVNTDYTALITEARKYKGFDTNARKAVEKAFFDDGKLLPAARRALKPYLNENMGVLSKEEALDAALDAEEKRLEDSYNRATALVSSLTTMNVTFQNVNKQLNRLAAKKNFGSNSDVALAGLMKIMSRRMYSSISDLTAVLENEKESLEQDNPFQELLRQIKEQAEQAELKVKKLYRDHAGHFFVEITGYLNQFLEDELKTDLGTALANGLTDEEAETFINKVIQQKLTEEDIKGIEAKGINIKLTRPMWKKYQTFILDVPKFNAILAGEYEDVSLVNRWLESYSSSNNPMVGSLAIWINDKKTEAEQRAYNKSLEFRKKLETILPKVGYSKNNTRAILDKAFFIDKVIDFDKETGKAIEREVYSLLQKFGNGWRYEHDKLQYDISLARQENDAVKIRESEFALKQFNDDYMHREFVPEFYEKDVIWGESDLAQQAWLERKLALDKINSVENRTEDELERLNQYTTLQDAKREYKQLFSMRNEDGTMKIGDEKTKTEIRLKHRNETSKFYEYYEKPNSLQESFNDLINKLESQNIHQLNKDGTPNDSWNNTVEEWILQNTRTVYTDSYYKERSEIFDRIGELQDKKNKNLDSDFDVKEAYSEMYDLIGMYKDSQGQPIPEDLGSDNIKRIKDLQQKINDYQDNMDSLSSLSTDERAELQGYSDMLVKEIDLNDIQKERFALLTDKDSKGLSTPEIVELKNLFARLKELSQKKPTDYYVDELNYLLSAFELAPIEDYTKVKDYINSAEFLDLVTEDSDRGEVLLKWFEDNHVTKSELVYQGKGLGVKSVRRYNPIPAHLITQPKDNNLIKTSELTNPLSDETITIAGIPNNRHTSSRIKNEYRTLPYGLTQEEKQKYIGKVIDNANNFLPRDFIPGNKYSAKDAKFINQEYAALEQNPSSAEFQLVKLLEEYMLDVQKGKSSYSKLYLDMPRFATNSIVESFQKGKFGSRLGQAQQAWQDWYAKSIGIGSKTKTGADQYVDKAFNYDKDNNLVNTNLDGEEISYVPVEGLFKLDIDRVDPDVIQNVLKYGMSLEAQSVLFENLPFAEAVLESLEESSPKNMKSYDKTAFKLGKKKRPSKRFATNHTLEQMKSLLNREFYGIVQSDFVQRNPEIAKIVSTLQRLSTVSALALNIPSDLKNKYGAMIQVAIEAAGAEFFNFKDMAAGRKFAFEAMMNWSSFGSKGIYAIGPAALTTQLIEIYDPVFKTKDQFGRSVQRSMWKDLVNGEWMYMHRRFGEMEVGITLFGSFMNATKVEQTIDGQKRLIKIKDAYQQDKDGIIKLKEGIDLEWNNVPIYHEIQKGESLESIAKNYGISVETLKNNNRISDELEVQEGDRLTIASSKKFKALRNRIQGVGRYLFGAYDEFGQAEGNKMIIYRMFAFMRKWFIPLWMHRWGMDFKNRKETGGYRYDFATGTVSKGFYMQNFRTLKDLITTKGEKFKYMSTRDKIAYRKATFEGMFIMVSALIASMLFGFDEDDDDKWSKVRGRTGALHEDTFNAPGFLINHSLLLLKGVQAETTTYLPLPNIFGIDMGLNDQIGLIQNSSVSFGNTVSLYAKILQDTWNFLAGNEKAYYQKKSGPYPWKEKGDLKLIPDFMRVFGFTGNTFDTETALKNLERSKERR